MDSSRVPKYTTQKYKTVGESSNVDESLFGEKSSRNSKSSNRITIKKTTINPIVSSAVVITAEELDRIKTHANIPTDAELEAEKEYTIRLKQTRENKAKERKTRMKELEIIAKQKAIKTDSEIAEETRNQTIRDLASEKMDMSHDVVKLLESMSARAVAFTLRDQQLVEKSKREIEDREYERRMDIIMEVDRLKDLKMREIQEENKRDKRIQDRKVITEQIEYRQKQKILSAEAREQENLQMRQLMKKYEEDDQRQRAQHLLEVERSKNEFIKANEEVLERKKLIKEKEKQEVQEILIYQAMKDAELAKREEEEFAIERAKKERQAQLLAHQERVQSNAGKVDELRARRHAEERERKQRQIDKELAIKKKNDMKILMEARVKQANDKQVIKEREKQQLQEQLTNDLVYLKAVNEREEKEMLLKKEKALEHRNYTLQMINERKEKSDRDRLLIDDEGTRYRQLKVQEVEKLKTIRNKLVNDLKDKGVYDKYLSEMISLDIDNLVKR
eukprot:gene21361-27672_t